MLEHVKSLWARSKVFRVILILALIYVGFRIIAQGVLLTGLIPLTAIQGDKEYLWRDLDVYLEAGEHFRQQQNLYFTETSALYPYPYAPSFALAFVPFTWLSDINAARLHTLLHLLAYGFLYFRWKRIFTWLDLEKADEIMAWTLPVWLMFAAFWNDLNALNIGVFMATLGTLFIEAVLKENLVTALLWLSVILQIKPHWSFAAAVPLLLGRWRFFVKLVVGAIVAYAVIMGGVMLIGGPAYGWHQHVDYVRRLLAYRGDFPWRTPADAPFLGFNHSIMQTMYFFFGVSERTKRWTQVLKALLLLPLAVTGLRYLVPAIRGLDRSSRPKIGLAWAFVLYLGAFLWLDVVWELSLGIAAFSYLMIAVTNKWTRITVSSVWLAYALGEFLEILSLLFLGYSALSPTSYVITNPNVYIPTIMFALLLFYGFLLHHLWKNVSEWSATYKQLRFEHS
jgi:hypothetical protein